MRKGSYVRVGEEAKQGRDARMESGSGRGLRAGGRSKRGCDARMSRGKEAMFVTGRELDLLVAGYSCPGTPGWLSGTGQIGQKSAICSFE